MLPQLPGLSLGLLNQFPRSHLKESCAYPAAQEGSGEGQEGHSQCRLGPLGGSRASRYIAPPHLLVCQALTSNTNGHSILNSYCDAWLLSLGGFPGGSDGKESACSAGDLGLIPELGRSPRERNSLPLQNSCLENSMDRGAWRLQSI